MAKVIIRRLGVLALVAGCAAEPTLGSVAPPIINGTADYGDPAVVALIGRSLAGNSYICTASVIGPRVLLTAAHCVISPELGAGAMFKAFLAQSIYPFEWTSGIDVQEVHYHPSYSPSNALPGSLFDIGVAITAQPLAIPPLPINRTPLTTAMIGTAVRMVGYGRTVAADPGTNGQKMQAPNKIAGLANDYVALHDGSHFACKGDSGGPSLMSQGGGEVIVGIESRGQSCVGTNFQVRTDLYASFIDPFLGNPTVDMRLTPDLAAAADLDVQPAVDMGAARDFSTQADTKPPVDLGTNSAPDAGGGCSLGHHRPSAWIALLLVGWPGLGGRKRRRMAGRGEDFTAGV